ncbi:hypothetical protein VKT23_002762 [Stygiomarasmius scandens]|uniref:Uncharacterized protein n=1 Tax=Marasmiellus scandens TaxID=2682957 RepID=A0ABR1JWN5_9AGAR
MHKQMGLEEQARMGTLGLMPVTSGVGGEGEALNDTDTTNKDAASLKSKITVTSGTTAGTSPRQPRKRIDSLNSLNPSTSRFSIVSVPLPFWRAPSPGPGPAKNGGSGSGLGWTSFFSLTGKGKSPADRHADDAKGANVNGNENEGVDDGVR